MIRETERCEHTTYFECPLSKAYKYLALPTAKAIHL